MATAHRVLLVEDDEGLRYALRVALERAGLGVDQAENGRDAVQLVNDRASEYSAVVLDMLLPQIHGSSVLTHIAKVAPDLCVMAVTGYPDRVLFTDPADRHVVRAIFVKPVEPQAVASFIRAHCDVTSAGISTPDSDSAAQ